MANGVAVIASNGVWYITGAETGSGVTATSIRLDKISNDGALSASSVVEAAGALFYFGIEGIMQITIDAINGAKAENITRTSIQTFYVNIGAASRAGAHAVYIPEQRKIYWGYRDNPASESLTQRTFNIILVLDLDIKGFYKYSIAESSQAQFPQIVGMSMVRPFAEASSSESVLELDGTEVTELDGTTPVTELITSDVGQISALKVATAVFSTIDSGWKVSFSTFHSRSFVDWFDYSSDGQGLPMLSFVEFAEFNMGAIHTKGKPTYVHSYFSKTSKNLTPGGYYELPPLYYTSTGLRVSQSVLEVLNKPSSNLRVTQSVLEVLLSPPSDFEVSQSILEVANATDPLDNVEAATATVNNLIWLPLLRSLSARTSNTGVQALHFHDPASVPPILANLYTAAQEAYYFLIYVQTTYAGEYNRVKTSEQAAMPAYVPVSESEFTDWKTAWQESGINLF